jgi:hypothetical protein
MDADAIAVEQVVAEVELVQGEGDEEGCECGGLVGGAEEGEDEVWPEEELVLERGERYAGGLECMSSSAFCRLAICGAALVEDGTLGIGVLHAYKKICLLPNRCPVRPGN